MFFVPYPRLGKKNRPFTSERREYLKASSVDSLLFANQQAWSRHFVSFASFDQDFCVLFSLLQACFVGFFSSRIFSPRTSLLSSWASLGVDFFLGLLLSSWLSVVGSPSPCFPSGLVSVRFSSVVFIFVGFVVVWWALRCGLLRLRVASVLAFCCLLLLCGLLLLRLGFWCFV